MGDLSMVKNQTEVNCVYNILLVSDNLPEKPQIEEFVCRVATNIRR